MHANLLFTLPVSRCFVPMSETSAGGDTACVSGRLSLSAAPSGSYRTSIGAVSVNLPRSVIPLHPSRRPWPSGDVPTPSSLVWALPLSDRLCDSAVCPSVRLRCLSVCATPLYVRLYDSAVCPSMRLRCMSVCTTPLSVRLCDCAVCPSVRLRCLTVYVTPLSVRLCDSAVCPYV